MSFDENTTNVKVLGNNIIYSLLTKQEAYSQTINKTNKMVS